MSSLVRLTNEAQSDLKAWFDHYMPELAYVAHSDMTLTQVACLMSSYYCFNDSLDRLAHMAMHEATEIERVLSRPTASTESHS